MRSRHSERWGKLRFYQVGSDKVVANPMVVKSDFRALKWLVNGPGTQAVFSSGLLVTGNEISRKGKSLVLQAESGFLVVGQSPQQPCLPAIDGVQLFRRRKLLLQELVGLTEGVLDKMWRGKEIKPGSLEKSLGEACIWGREVQRVVVIRLKSIWQLVASSVPQSLVFVPVLFNNFTNDLDKAIAPSVWRWHQVGWECWSAEE